MGYLLHPQIMTPPDDEVIWRYMDLPKFLLMLEQKGLYFATLEEFEDKWEAVIGREMSASIANNYSAVSGQIIELFQAVTRHTAVNCWYRGATESVAMWKLYTNSEFGVAIKSTVGNLKQSLEVTSQDVFIGNVVYEDHTDPPKQVLANDQMSPYRAVLQKRVCYQHEHELRAMTDFLPDFPTNAPLGTVVIAQNPTHGATVPVELSRLIISITTGPNFPEWAWELLASALARAGLNCPVGESDAFRPPTARVIER